MNNNGSNNVPVLTAQGEPVVAQGDVLFVRISGIPSDVTAEVKNEEAGKIVVTHSETGHHHAIYGGPNIAQLFGTSDPLTSFLKINSPAGAEVKHERPWDTHPTIALDGGSFWKVLRQGEPRPEGWKAVMD